MLKRVAVTLLLVAFLAVGAAFSGSQSEEVITPEEFAAFFQICYRPPAITADHLRYIDQLPGFGLETMEFLEEAVPITTVEQLKAVHGIGPKKSFILRVLFDLSPDKEPYQTGQEEVTEKVEALETQLQKLLRPPAEQIEREIGVHYETAWYMAKRIRKAMKHDVFEDRLGGVIEVDAAVVRASGDGTPKDPTTFEGKNVLGVAERGGCLRMMILDGLKARDIKCVVAKNLGEVQEIYSDAASRFFFLTEFGRHEDVAHVYNEYVVEEAHVDTIENAWSLFKRGPVGMYHHVSAKYLQDYLDESAFRYLHRKEKDAMFDLVPASCAAR